MADANSAVPESLAAGTKQLYTLTLLECKVVGRGEDIMDKRITRREFLRMTGFGFFTIFIMPGIKKLNLFKKSYKEARYYRRLAG